MRLLIRTPRRAANFGYVDVRNWEVGVVAYATQKFSQVCNSAVAFACKSKCSAAQQLFEIAILRWSSRSPARASWLCALAVGNSKVGALANATQSLSQVCNSPVVVNRKSNALQSKICVAIVRLRQGSN